MPSERFLHLPEEKKTRIIKAALKEFARVSYDEISINRIIQDAGIPRGSFYQYFDDKQDLQLFLLEDFREQLKEKVRPYLDGDKGDMFCFFRDALPEIVKVGMSYEFKDVCKNTFSQLRYGGICPGNKVFAEDGKWLFEEFNKRAMEKESTNYLVENMIPAWEILIQLIKEAVVRIFLFEESENEVIEKYNKKIMIVEAGMKAKETKDV